VGAPLHDAAGDRSLEIAELEAKNQMLALLASLHQTIARMERPEGDEPMESAVSESFLASIPSIDHAAHASSRLSTIVDGYRWPTSTSTATQVFTSQIDQATSADDLPTQLSATVDRATSALRIESLLAESDAVGRAARASQSPPVVAFKSPNAEHGLGSEPELSALSVAPDTPTASLGATPRSPPQYQPNLELSPIAKPPRPHVSTSLSFEEMERRCLAQQSRTQGLSSPFEGHITNEGFHVGGCNMGALSDKDWSEARPQPIVPTPAS